MTLNELAIGPIGGVFDEYSSRAGGLPISVGHHTIRAIRTDQANFWVLDGQIIARVYGNQITLELDGIFTEFFPEDITIEDEIVGTLSSDTITEANGWEKYESQNSTQWSSPIGDPNAPTIYISEVRYRTHINVEVPLSTKLSNKIYRGLNSHTKGRGVSRAR